MNWIPLTNDTDLDALKEASNEKHIMIFKHSTRCSISSMVLGRLERAWSDNETVNIKPYYLDLLQNREISNRIAEVFQVEHASPQVLMLRNGEVIYDDSHMNINYDNIKAFAKN